MFKSLSTISLLAVVSQACAVQLILPLPGENLPNHKIYISQKEASHGHFHFKEAQSASDSNAFRLYQEINAFNQNARYKKEDAKRNPRIVVNNVTLDTLKQYAEPLHLEEKDGKWHFAFQLWVTPFTTGKSETEAHYQLFYDVSIPTDKIDQEKSLMIEPVKIELLDGSGFSRHWKTIYEKK